MYLLLMSITFISNIYIIFFIADYCIASYFVVIKFLNEIRDVPEAYSELHKARKMNSAFYSKER